MITYILIGLLCLFAIFAYEIKKDRGFDVGDRSPQNLFRLAGMWALWPVALILFIRHHYKSAKLVKKWGK